MTEFICACVIFAVGFLAGWRWCLTVLDHIAKNKK